MRLISSSAIPKGSRPSSSRSHQRPGATSRPAPVFPRETIARVADMYMSATNVVIGWTMGITHHLHGVENVQMIANLALLRGMIGRPSAGLLPIRGHSNVQGMGSVGVTPSLKKAILARLEERLGIRGSDAPGLDTMACIEACGRGDDGRGAVPRRAISSEAIQMRRLRVRRSASWS